MVDAATGIVLEAGNSSQGLFGFKPSTLVGRNVSDIIAALRPTPPTSAATNAAATGAGDQGAAGAPGGAAAAAAAPTGAAAAGGNGSGTGHVQRTDKGESKAGGNPATTAATKPRGRRPPSKRSSILSVITGDTPLSTQQLLCQLAAASMTVNGASWCVTQVLGTNKNEKERETGSRCGRCGKTICVHVCAFALPPCTGKHALPNLASHGFCCCQSIRKHPELLTRCPLVVAGVWA